MKAGVIISNRDQQGQGRRKQDQQEQTKITELEAFTVAVRCPVF